MQHAYLITAMGQLYSVESSVPTEALDESRLVWVETVCCRKPGQVTREQIDKAYQHTVSCPHCGRFSEFAECQNTDKENAHERE